MLRAFVIAATVAVFVPSATASQKTGFAFGRTGGNIRPFSVVVSVDGSVRTTGVAEVGNPALSRLELGRLNHLAVTTGFTHLETRTNCANTLADAATTYIRVGALTVRVHGNCVAPYRRLWVALVKATRVSY